MKEKGMTKDISNSIIVYLLVIAVLITIVGTVITVGKITDLEILSGAAVDTASGRSNLTITAATAITNNLETINFGSGYVNGTCSRCEMTTLYGSNATCCVDFNNASSGGFLLENTGNTNISVGFICEGSCEGDEFIGNASTISNITIWVVDKAGDAATSPTLATESGVADTTKSCTGTAHEWDGWIARRNQTNTTPSNQTIGLSDGTGAWLCGNATAFPLESATTRDAGVFHLNVTIHSTEIGTGRRANITLIFNATSAG